MKIKYLIYIISFLCLSCNKEEELYDNCNCETIITAYDINEVAKNILPDFQLVRKDTLTYLSPNYIFALDDTTYIDLTVCLFKSSTYAYFIINDYMDYYFESGKGSEIGSTIGDSMWWSGDKTNKESLYIVFIRNNVAIGIHSENYNNNYSLAKKLDDDILNKEKYITFQ